LDLGEAPPINSGSTTPVPAQEGGTVEKDNASSFGGTATVTDPEKMVVFFFNCKDKAKASRGAGCDIFRVYQRDAPGECWNDVANAESQSHVSEKKFSSKGLWLHGKRDHITPKFKIKLSPSYLISAWLHFDCYLTGPMRSKPKWRTLACACVDGDAKRAASYHVLLRCVKEDIQIGPYLALPDEGTEKSFKNMEGVFMPVCTPGTNTPTNFYPALKDGTFFHIAVHGEGPTTDKGGTTFPGFTTVYINGKKEGECEGYVGIPIETIGQCARGPAGRDSYGIQHLADFRVYHLREEICLDTPSPQTREVLKHAIVPLKEYPALPDTQGWKEVLPKKNKSRRALSDHTNRPQPAEMKENILKLKQEPSTRGTSGGSTLYDDFYRQILCKVPRQERILTFTYKDRTFTGRVGNGGDILYYGKLYSTVGRWALHCTQNNKIDGMRRVKFRGKFLRDCLIDHYNLDGGPKRESSEAKVPTVSLFKYCATEVFAGVEAQDRVISFVHKEHSFHATVDNNGQVVQFGQAFPSFNAWALHCAQTVVPISWVDSMRRVKFRGKAMRECLLEKLSGGTRPEEKLKLSGLSKHYKSELARAVHGRLTAAAVALKRKEKAERLLMQKEEILVRKLKKQRLKDEILVRKLKKQRLKVQQRTEENERLLMAQEESLSRKYKRDMNAQMKQQLKAQREADKITFTKDADDCSGIFDGPMRTIFGLETAVLGGRGGAASGLASLALKPFMAATKEETFEGLCRRVLKFEYDINVMLLDLIVKDYSNKDVKLYVERRFPIKDFFVAKAFCRAIREEWSMLPETKGLTLSNRDIDQKPLFQINEEFGWESDSCAICDECFSPFRETLNEDCEKLVRCDGCIFNFHVLCIEKIMSKAGVSIEKSDVWFCPICEASQHLRRSVLAKDVKAVVEAIVENRFCDPFWSPPVSAFNRSPDLNAVQIAASDGDVEMLQILLNPFIASEYRAHKNRFTVPPPVLLLRAWNSGTAMDACMRNGHVGALLQLRSRGGPVSDASMLAAVQARATRALGGADDFSKGMELAKIEWKTMDETIVFVHKNVESEGCYTEYKRMKGCRCDLSRGFCHFSKSCEPLVVSDKTAKEHEQHRNQSGAQVECNYMCPCHALVHCRRNPASSGSYNCGRRQLQNGCQVPLEIVPMNDGRGFGVRSLARIPKGTFVTEYVGEVISQAENVVREQQRAGAEFYTWELNNNFVIDATKYRNVGAFVNHQCKRSNLAPVKVLVNNQRPRMAFFAKRDIEAGEEVTINYWTGVRRTLRSGFGENCLCTYCKAMRRAPQDEARSAPFKPQSHNMAGSSDERKRLRKDVGGGASKKARFGSAV
jgi:hypothetical protein